MLFVRLPSLILIPSIRTLLRRPIHTKITTLHLPKILEQKATLEISIRMQNRIQFARRPERLILDLNQIRTTLTMETKPKVRQKTNLLKLILVRRLKHPIARDMISLLTHIFPHLCQESTVADAHGLEEGDQVVRRVRPVRAAVGLTTAGQCFGEQLVAGIGRVASATTVLVAADVAVGVADVVEVFGFEFVYFDVSIGSGNAVER